MRSKRTAAFVAALFLIAACGGEDPPVAGNPDTDGDGIENAVDACPAVRETVNGYQDSDGCPDSPPAADADGDGISDDVDNCPSERETPNGYQDSDGCPDTVPTADADGDGIADGADACPSAREVVNTYQDSDGCPDVNPRYAGRWAGVVTMQLDGESPFQYNGVLNGTPNGTAVAFSPICPNGDGAITTTTYTNQNEVSWSGSLSCTPVAFTGCSSVVLRFTGGAFSLTSAGNLGVAGGGVAMGCSISKGFQMTFGGVRQ